LILPSVGFTHEFFIDMPSGTCNYKLRIDTLLDLLHCQDLLQYLTCCIIGLAKLLILAALLGLAALLDWLRSIYLLRSLDMLHYWTCSTIGQTTFLRLAALLGLAVLLELAALLN
jgi:hypothetical protein